MAKKVIIGVILAIFAIFILLITAILTAALTPGFWMGAKDAEEDYDDWLYEAEEDDTVTVFGKIKQEERLDANIIGMDDDRYAYRLEGCAASFWSETDIGDVDENVVVIIQIKDQNGAPTPMVVTSVPQGGAYAPNACCCCFSGILFIVAILLIILGIAKGSKNKTKAPKKKKDEIEE